jgi:hypothetical protein
MFDAVPSASKAVRLFLQPWEDYGARTLLQGVDLARVPNEFGPLAFHIAFCDIANGPEMPATKTDEAAHRNAISQPLHND